MAAELDVAIVSRGRPVKNRAIVAAISLGVVATTGRSQPAPPPPQATWNRETAWTITRMPEGQVLAIDIVLDMPSIYRLVGTPRTDITPTARFVVPPTIDVQTLENGDTRIRLRAQFAEPSELPAHLLRFTCAMPDPDGIDLPFRPRNTLVVLADGDYSRKWQFKFYTQSNPDGFYEPLP
jgi:hypothetical protein